MTCWCASTVALAPYNTFPNFCMIQEVCILQEHSERQWDIKEASIPPQIG